MWWANRAWRKAIYEHVSLKENQITIYHLLCTLLMDCDMFLEALHSFKIYDIFQFYYHFYSLTSKVHVHNTMCCQGLLHLVMFHINFYIISIILVILHYCVYFSGPDIQCKTLLNASFLSLHLPCSRYCIHQSWSGCLLPSQTVFSGSKKSKCIVLFWM